MKLISYPFKKGSISCSLSYLWDRHKPLLPRNTSVLKITGEDYQGAKAINIIILHLLNTFWDLNIPLLVTWVFIISNCLIRVFQDWHSLNSDSPLLWLHRSGKEKSTGENNSTDNEYCTHLPTPVLFLKAAKCVSMWVKGVGFLKIALYTEL